MLLQISSFFSFLPQKTLKMTILTSVWSAQHPNPGQTIQHLPSHIFAPSLSVDYSIEKDAQSEVSSFDQ